MEYEREFLPAVLEITEKPPAAFARVISGAVIVFLVSALAWAILGHVDVVAIAPGKLIPAGQVKTVQPFEGGVVRRIHVTEGQKVQEGDLLVELDAAVSNADVQSTRQRILKLKKTLPLVTEKAQGLKKLLESGMVSRTAWLEVEEQRISQEQDLAALQQELLKVRERQRWQRLTAPVSGTVQQLAVHTIGGVVTPAQPLMVIVPQGYSLEIEAWLPNKDIGFVSEGLEARVKVDTFPFTRYGTLDAVITDVSDDAVEDKNLGWVYTTRAALKSQVINVEGREVRLSPGMTVMLELKTSRRRIIDYFLSPVMRYRDESIRER